MRAMHRLFSAAAVILWATMFGTAVAQEQQDPTQPARVQNPLPDSIPANSVVKVFKAKHNTELVNSIITGYRNVVVLTQVDQAHGIFSVMGGPDTLAQIEETIAKYDVPTKNAELTFYLVEASNTGGASEIPKALESVVAELQRTLVYKKYLSLSPVILRVRDGRAVENMGVIPAQPAGPEDAELHGRPGMYRVRVEEVRVHGDEGTRVITMDTLEVSLEGPQRIITTPLGEGKSRVEEVEGRQSQIRTSIDVPENQTVVVGKANVGVDDKALFVVVTAKVVD